jgi:integrase
MSVLVRERNGKWWIFTNHNKQRAARCLGVGPNAKKAANLAAVQIAAQLAVGNTAALEKTAAPSAVPTFAQVAAAWPKWQQGLYPVRATTLKARESFLRVHLVPAFGAKAISDVTRGEIQAFIAAKRKDLADSALRVGLITLSLILGYAVERGEIAVNPMKGGARLWKPEQPDGPDPFTREERDALILAADLLDPRWGVMIAVWSATGMRSGEIRGLEVQDVIGGALSVRRTLTLKTASKPKTSRSVRTVPIPSALLNAALAGAGAVGPLFPSPSSPGPIHEKELTRFWARTVKSAAVRYRTVETLRHTRISIDLSDGMPLLQVAAEVGDSPATILKYYAKWLAQPGAAPAQPSAAGVSGAASLTLQDHRR